MAEESLLHMSAEEVDAMLLSLVRDNDEDAAPGSPLSTTTDTESCGDSAAEELRRVPVVMVAPGLGSRTYPPKRARPVSSHLDEYPPAFDEESRKERKMARNRRAAANSRARKKEKLDTLAAQVAELQRENASLRRRLTDAGLMHESGCDADVARPDTRGQYPLRQPAVLPTHSPQLECYQPLVRATTIACYLCMLALLAVSRPALAAAAAASPRSRSGPTAAPAPALACASARSEGGGGWPRARRERIRPGCRLSARRRGAFAHSVIRAGIATAH